MTVNTLEDISSSDLSSFISSDVAEDMILFAKNFFNQKKKRGLLTGATNVAYFPPKY